MKYLIIIIFILIPFKHTNGGSKYMPTSEEIIKVKMIQLEVLKSKIRVEIAELKYK